MYLQPAESCLHLVSFLVLDFQVVLGVDEDEGEGGAAEYTGGAE